MKKMILVMTIMLISSVSFAGEIKGLRCQTNYIVHEKNKSLGIDRAGTQKSMFGIAALDETISAQAIENMGLRAREIL